MKYNILGKTKFKVSHMCFGSLTIGPLQKNLSDVEGSKVILKALENGVNIIDTAELYENYSHIRESLKSIERSKVHIMTKSYAYDKVTAEASLKKALKELDTDYVDGFLLHEQESEHTLRGHFEAIEYFIKMKEKGYIRSVGISTHNVAGVNAVLNVDEIDVIHPIINKYGIGINDGTTKDMLNAIENAKKKNIGIYAMKPLGGGNLIGSYDEALDFVLNLDSIDSIAIGMQSVDEVEANILKFSNKEIPNELKEKLNNVNRKLKIDYWCVGCGECEKKCSHKAISIINKKAVVDETKCVLCGYCSKYCKDFCIKVI